MSGGLFNYEDMSLKHEIFDYEEKPTNVFEDREISELVWDMLNLIHEFDWYRSGDTGEEDYLKAKMKFKEKWLPFDDNRRVKRTIDDSLNDLRIELYKTFGLSKVPFSIDDLSESEIATLKERGWVCVPPSCQKIEEKKMERVQKQRS